MHHNQTSLAHYLSEDRKTDGEIAPHLIKQVGKLDSITADKGYDQSRVYIPIRYSVVQWYGSGDAPAVVVALGRGGAAVALGLGA